MKLTLHIGISLHIYPKIHKLSSHSNIMRHTTFNYPLGLSFLLPRLPIPPLSRSDRGSQKDMAINDKLYTVTETT